MNFEFKTNKTTLDVHAYSVRILGEPKMGKTSLYKNLIDLYKKETNNPNIAVLLPLEDGYKQLNDIEVLTVQNKMLLDNFKELQGAINTIIMAKKDPNHKYYGVKIVCIDTTTMLEVYLKDEVVRRDFESSGVAKEFNATFNGYGACHRVARAILANEIMKPLKSCGITIYYTSHAKTKKNVDILTGKEYNYVASSTTDGFDSVILNDVSISVGVLENATIKDKRKVVDGRVFRFRSNELYKSVGARFNKGIPETIKCGNSPQESAKIFYDIMKNAILQESGLENESEIKETMVEQAKEVESNIKASIIDDERKLEIKYRNNLHQFIKSLQLSEEWIAFLSAQCENEGMENIEEFIMNVDYNKVETLGGQLGYKEA